MNPTSPTLSSVQEKARTISWPSADSHGWPTLLRRHDGSLMVAYSGGRDAHICPFGRVEIMVSRDGGETWSWPRVILDSDLDDRDAGLTETQDGTLLLTTFSHTVYDEVITELEAGNTIHFNAEGQIRAPLLTHERLPAWRAARHRLPDDERRPLRGEWILRSTDQGKTWSAPYRSLVNSPHGPTVLSDGRLLYVGKDMRNESEAIRACESCDDGKSWQWLATLPTREGDLAAKYHEPHAIETADGRIIAQIRNHNPRDLYETLQSESFDGGRTWSTPHLIGVWGFPSHLLRISDGNLLMTYSHRRAPFNCQARISRDHGESWSDPIHLYPDTGCADFGYPSTIELENGRVLTIWYEAIPGQEQTVLRQLRWNLDWFAKHLTF